jgi:hypothetical protein
MATNNIIFLISSAVSFVGIHYWGGSEELSLVSNAICWQRKRAHIVELSFTVEKNLVSGSATCPLGYLQRTSYTGDQT